MMRCRCLARVVSFQPIQPSRARMRQAGEENCRQAIRSPGGALPGSGSVDAPQRAPGDPDSDGARSVRAPPVVRSFAPAGAKPVAARPIPGL